MILPAITVDLAKLRHNIESLCALCHSQGITMAAVTKCVCADKHIVELLNSMDVDIIADSRIANLASIKTDKPRMLIRIPMPSEAEEVVRNSELAMISEPETIRLIGAAARAQHKLYKLVLMIDMGDLREGVFFMNTEELLEAAQAIVDEDGLELYGVGANFTCFGGIIPDRDNLGRLVSIANMLRDRYSLPIPLISGGNSSTVGSLLNNEVPYGITNLCIGEGYLLGNDTSVGKLIPGYNGDAFIISAQLIELKLKPSKPIGRTSINAFGEKVDFNDRGDMRRGILALGRQDVDPSGLTPVDRRVEILGASSDHTIVNLTNAPEYKLGDTLELIPNYGALLRAYTGKYIEKHYKNRGKI